MKILKRILIIFLIIIAVFITTALSFKIIFSQKPVELYEINSNSNNNILIVTQGSKFKNELVDRLIDDLDQEKIHIKVIGVSSLDQFNPEDWQYIIILCSVEANKLHKNIDNFAAGNKDNKKIILVTVSGSGKWEYENKDIDTITTASKMSNINQIKQKILSNMKLE